MKRDSLIKAGLTTILVVILFSKINIHELLDAFLSLDVYYLILSLFFVPILYIIRTYRWSVLLKSVEIDKSFVDLGRVLLIGVFYGLITPGKVGELARAYYLNEKKSVTISTIIMEKLVDILILALLSIITIISFFYKYTIFNYIILISVLAAILGTWLLANKKIISILARPFNIKYEDVEVHTNSFSKLCKDRKAMSKTTLLGLMYYSQLYSGNFNTIFPGCYCLCSRFSSIDYFDGKHAHYHIRLGNERINRCNLFCIIGGIGGSGCFIFVLLIF
jgi:glycosyltransferase 2 family protein